MENEKEMNYPKNTAFLEITSWEGISWGAEHYYGKLILNTDTYDEIELQQVMTIKYGKELDKKDNGHGIWERAARRKETTGRFKTKKSIINIAKTKCEELEIVFLILGKSGCIQSQKVLLAPDHINIKRLNELALELDTLNTNHTGNDDKWDEIDKEYFELINQPNRREQIITKKEYYEN